MNLLSTLGRRMGTARNVKREVKAFLFFLAVASGTACAFAAQSPELKSLQEQVVRTEKQGQWAEAIRLAGEVLGRVEVQNGPESPEAADALYVLERLYLRAGEITHAQDLHPRTQALMEKFRGQESSETAQRFTELAWAYKLSDDAATADVFFRRALEVNERLLGPNDAKVADTLTDLGVFSYDLHDFARAENYLRRALQASQSARGSGDTRNGRILHFLGLTHQCLGNFPKAEDCFQQALSVLEKTNGPKDLETAHSLNAYGSLCRIKGSFSQAEQLHLRALGIMEKVRGMEHPDTAYVLIALGMLCETTGEFAKGELFFARAAAINEKHWGRDHSFTLEVLQNWAHCKISAGRTASALELTLQAQPARERRLMNVLCFGSAAQRLAFKDYAELVDNLASLGSAQPLAAAVLRCKGVVFDSLLEDHLLANASADLRTRTLIAQLSQANQRLEQLDLAGYKTFASPSQPSGQSEKQILEKMVEQLESDLARQVTGLGHARHALSVTLSQVQAAIPGDAALVELVHYEHYLGKGNWESRYGAVTVFHDAEPNWVPLGAAEAIDKNVKLYQHLVKDTAEETSLCEVLRALYGQLWAPIAAVLPAETRTVIISPDGELNFISFATLLSPSNQFLGEMWRICYVTTGRDLLPNRPPRGLSASLQVWANPDFGAGVPLETRPTNTLLTSRSATMRELRDLKFNPLPGAERESRLLEKRASELGFDRVELHLGKEATEAALRQVEAPQVLHLATHGFFLPDAVSGSKLNPMFRSGLARAGAQRTISAWVQGKALPPENDGIVTAEEISTLNLQGTWLVVLSACNTGLGVAQSGEGVLGLRRGFIQAGAQNLVMTLWPIDDERTVPLMTDFYVAAHQSANAPQALAHVQGKWLAQLRTEEGVAKACQTAGPFILSFKGRL